MRVSRRPDHSTKKFWLSTVSAQLHLMGCILMLVGSIFLLPLALPVGPAHFWACVTFIVSGCLVFAVSATYHFLGDGFEASPRLHEVLEDLDHYSIYLFIAGTYTPFLLNAVADPWTKPLLFLVWFSAIVGILYTRFRPKLPKFLQSRAVYTGIFVMMGWILVIRFNEIIETVSSSRLWLLALGGAAYSLGAVVYATKKPKLWVGVFGFHELWHLMVLIGAGFHFFLVLSFYR